MIQVRILLSESSLAAKRKEKAKTKAKVETKTEAIEPKSTIEIFETIFGRGFGGLDPIVSPKIDVLEPEDYVSEHEWSYKEPNPFIYRKKNAGTAWEELVNATTVVTKADGPELELIRTHFQNIPWVINKRGICEWTGEFAKFIALNFDFKS